MLYEDPLAAAVQINSTVVPVRPWATTTAGGGGESACARPACISTPAQGEATKARIAMRRRAITADLTLASGTQTRMGHESHPDGHKSHPAVSAKHLPRPTRPPTSALDPAERCANESGRPSVGRRVMWCAGNGDGR